MTENKYKNGKIYTIRCRTDDSLIYVGSTIEPRLSVRFNKHKYQKGCSLYQYIQNTNGNWIDWYIELYEEFSCENKEQLNKREGEIIREISTINKLNHLKQTKEEIKERDKIWREKNKDKLLEQQKNYVEKNREQILLKKSEYNKANKEHKNNYMKERYQKKREQILSFQKEYKAKNREYILEKIICSCGCTISRKGIREHERTKKHLSFLKETQETKKQETY